MAMSMELVKVTIRKNDQVQVIAGREKGKTGKVLRVLPKTGRVVVEKVNMVKRHVKPTQKNPQGGVLEKETSLHFSNVQLMCPKCNRGVRHGIKVVEKTAGKKGAVKHTKVRVCKRCGETIGTA
jgi:large subunit ribosomal protein L24